MVKKASFNFTEKELEVLRVMWSTQEPLVASDITRLKPALNINTVQTAVRSLLKKGTIEVADIVYSGTVLTRSYKPRYGEEELSIGIIVEEINKLDHRIPIPRVVAALLGQEKDKEAVISELEKMIADKKKELGIKE